MGGAADPGFVRRRKAFIHAFQRDYDVDRALYAASIREPHLRAQVLNDFHVRAEIERGRSARLLETADDLSADDIIKRLQLIAFADPGELIEHRRIACPGCWCGVPSDPDHIDPDCSACRGDGVSQVVLADTRYLSPAGKALYAGVRVRAGVIEVLMRDQVAALEALGRIYGVFEADNRQKQDGLQKLVEYIQANTRGLPAVEIVDVVPAKLSKS